MSGCEQCAYFVYDEDAECDVCMMNMDEDEWYRIRSSRRSGCPYFRPEDEYAIAGKQ